MKPPDKFLFMKVGNHATDLSAVQRQSLIAIDTDENVAAFG